MTTRAEPLCPLQGKSVTRYTHARQYNMPTDIFDGTQLQHSDRTLQHFERSGPALAIRGSVLCRPGCICTARVGSRRSSVAVAPAAGLLFSVLVRRRGAALAVRLAALRLLHLLQCGQNSFAKNSWHSELRYKPFGPSQGSATPTAPLQVHLPQMLEARGRTDNRLDLLLGRRRRGSAHLLPQRIPQPQLLLHRLFRALVHDVDAPPQRPLRPLARVLVLERQPLLQRAKQSTRQAVWQAASSKIAPCRNNR